MHSVFLVDQNWIISLLNNLLNQQISQLNAETKNHALNHNFLEFWVVFTVLLCGKPCILTFIEKKAPELKTLEWDILNPNYLIWVSNGHTFYFRLKPFFLGYSREKSILYINLKWRAKFQIYRIFIHDSDWLNFIHFSGYKYKIRFVIKKKRGSSINLDINHSKVFSSVCITIWKEIIFKERKSIYGLKPLALLVKMIKINIRCFYRIR